MPFNKPIAVVVVLVSLLQFVSAQRTVQEQSSLTDPADQCKYYNYPPVSTQITNFPATWQTAKILPSDSAARTKFSEISSGIPQLPIKGLKAKQTYDKADPDCWWTATECTKPKHAGVPEDLSVVPEPQTLGYGFDDGPNCSHNAFYDYLTQQKQKATMFFIGSNVIGWPLQAKRAFEDGHEICVHTWSHQELTGMTDEEVFSEIWYTVSLAITRACAVYLDDLWLVTGASYQARYWRYYHMFPPSLWNILWKHDTYDTIPDKSTGKVEVASVRKNYESFVATANSGAFAREGAILLAHETNNMTMQEAVSYYPQLKAAFKYIVPVGVAMNITQPYVETSFSQPSFEQYVAGTLQTQGPASNPKSGSPNGGDGKSGNSSTPSGSTSTNLGNGASSASFPVISSALMGVGLALFVSAML
ncbi:hypothetical protein E1B28_006695 [Marasmius oreades]|uniref:chitin deacetylase n=1 Tax=Marasmius oreades TaxID=181124 RepID=A0A9P8AAW8_9AGAR|nr:uncharacterized protein E1B28_006695 [Marasmius oreades]KAG7096013.1 hypothetical protein E1B28_006695 [Marasmius oreades]